jgi:2'-hydroxyisoflavone reductase
VILYDVKLLVIGGTVFVGRHFVEHALQSGHEVTVFHRGQHGADLFRNAKHLFGDRDGNLKALEEGKWDAVIDCCGYVPRIVRQSAELLRDKVGRYLFVSTISVYADPSVPNQNESALLGQLEDEAVEEVTGATYGPLKVLCENVVNEQYGDRAFIVRPGLINGPYDPTDRYPYWVERILKGGKVLVPNRPQQPMQLIDGRDLAAFMLLGLQENLSGSYNAAGPETPRTFGDMITSIHHLNPSAGLHWAGPELLERNDVSPWQDLPLALPFDGSSDGLQQIDASRAINDGLTFRSWDETARDTAAWVQTLPPDRPRRFGLAPEKEAAALSERTSEPQASVTQSTG